MLLKITNLLVLCMMLSTIVHAQKNRSYASDCFNLMELLQKDYLLIEDPMLRNDVLIQDRKRIIITFKNYVDGNYKFSGDETKYSNAVKTITASRNEIKLNQNSITRYNSNSLFNGTYGPKDQDQQVQRFNGKISSDRDDLVDAEYEIFVLELESILKHFDNKNPYLTEILNVFKDKFEKINTFKPDPYAMGAGSGTVQKSFSLFSGGALTFTEAIDGLSQFIAGRLKEELATQVFDKFKDELNKYGELKILLPTTFNFLEDIEPDQYAKLVNTLKEHVREDLNQLLINLPKIKDSPMVAAAIKRQPELNFIFLGLDLINQLRVVENPMEVLFILEGNDLIDSWAHDTNNTELHNIAHALKLSCVITNGLLVQEGHEVRIVGLEAWRANARNKYFYNLFLGFLLQQNRIYYDVRFVKKDKTQQALTDLLIAFKSNSAYSDSIMALGQQIEGFLMDAKSVGAQIQEIHKLRSSSKKIGKDTILMLLNSSVSLLEKGSLVTNKMITAINPANIPDYKNNFADYLNYSKDAIRIYSSIQDQAYIEALSIGLEAIVKHTGNRDPNFVKVTEFLVSTAKASTADEFEAVVEQFALPAGSSSIKRKTNYNLAINTFPGFFLSGERARNAGNDAWAFNAAFTVPVGLANSWGLKNEGSFSIMASVIDIGAVTSFRFNGDDAELPELTFKNILAPGLHFIYGFPDSPLSIGAGVQYGPGLREITVDTNGAKNEIDVSTFRVGVTITFDIPLVNLYTSYK